MGLGVRRCFSGRGLAIAPSRMSVTVMLRSGDVPIIMCSFLTGRIGLEAENIGMEEVICAACYSTGASVC